ncbi:TetR/AcrR family transcriptional regulator [Allokutzneria sp. NRRL B-24872]|uniref:TetR/AcrR family transcriptional regulator n=1 Tax=Allokutzneria sp. NRRL B-24872 TaxID=1137961 RepID=UPI000A374506|nr:TetR/AcrR family transcriptional regulator [Allokutzneria sp. NRRL B-24872]
MSVEERRSMIVHAVLPLLVEHGAAVTTSQIARAAGIGEGTIFRAFKDKDELFDACTVEALRPDHVLDAIAEIPLDQPLEKRLAEAAEALGAHLERMSALMAALHPLGRTRRSPMKSGRRESMNAMREAVTELFAPERDRLRLPADQLASLFLSLLFSGKRLSLEASPTTSQVIDVFLRGAVGAA